MKRSVYNKLRRKIRQCPICKTDESVIYDMGTHAGGFNGDESHDGNYFCDKCGGEFRIQYEIKSETISYLKIEYKSERTDRSDVLTRA